MEFAGLNPDAVTFYAELRDHNDKAWWMANKRRYDEHVRAPFDALAEILAPEFGPLKIFRPYRDVRFSADKSPYKDHIGLVSRESHGSVHYLQLGADGLMAAGGTYDTSTPQLAEFRAIVDDSRRWPDLDATLEDLGERGFTLIEDDALATAPRGYSVEHPRIHLLRLKRLAVARREAPAEWMWARDAADRIRDLWRDVSIWCDWLAENAPAASVARG